MGQDADTGGQIGGAKVVLMIGVHLLVLRRDHTPGIAFPGMLDLPGGGIEPGEDAHDCAIRETFEEVGLRLRRADLRHCRIVAGRRRPFAIFVAALPAGAEKRIVFGDEGEGWGLMAPETFIAASDAIASLASAVTAYRAAGLLPSPG